MWGGHVMKAYSRTQSNIALSSAEAELYATVTAASEGLGLSSMARDYGMEIQARLHVDATAAIGIAERKGLGKVRHLDTQSLWIQDAVRSKRVTLEKVAGPEHPADLMTKHLDQKTLDGHLKRMSICITDGRAAAAPSLAKDVEQPKEWLEAVSCFKDKRVTWADLESEDDGERGCMSLVETEELLSADDDAPGSRRARPPKHVAQAHATVSSNL